MCTIPFAPHLVDLDLKVKSQFWNLGPKTRKMFDLNELIKAENRVPVEFGKLKNPKKCGNAPRFHTWGLKSNKSETREHERPGNWFYRICGYRLNDWREYHIEAKLHFSDHVRLRAGKCVLKYFLSLYELTNQVQMEPDMSKTDYPTDTDNMANSDSSSTTDSSSSSSYTSSSTDSSSSSSTTGASTASSGTTATNSSSVIYLKTVIRNTEPERTNFSCVEYGVDDEDYRYVGPLH